MIHVSSNTMTAYQGGKKRIGKRIADVIKREELKRGFEGLDYLEPFCGMCGVLYHMVDGKRRVEASDINEDVILMWQAVKEGWLPEGGEITKEEFNALKHSNVKSKERAFYGTVCSFNAEFMGGYRKYKLLAKIKSALNSLVKFTDVIQNVSFDCCEYTDLKPVGKLIYCDPPYVNNNYSRNLFFRKFNNDLFWETMREWSVDNVVIISEREAPDDFECIWEHDYYTVPNQNMYSKKHVERLFINGHS